MEEEISYQHLVQHVGASGQQGGPLHSSERVDCSGTIPRILLIFEKSHLQTLLLKSLP
jgi:hypothetical protein